MRWKTIAWAVMAILSFGLLGDSRPVGAWLRQLRFSPDGTYVLAETDNEIIVLTVEPLAVKYRIPAAASTPAQFTHDSKEIVFVSSIPGADRNKIATGGGPAHVERWSIADGARRAVTEVSLQECETVALSPTGDALTCATFDGTLRVIEVQSGAPIFEKLHFAQDPEFFDARSPLPFEFYPSDKGAANLDYSPDGRYLMASTTVSIGDDLGFDLRERRIIPLVGGLKRLRSYWGLSFAFVSSNLILVSGTTGSLRQTLLTTLVEVPSGRVVSTATLPPGRSPTFAPFPISRLTDPDFVMIHPFGRPTFCAYDFRTNEAITSEHPAIDVLGNLYVAEPTPGEVGLYRRGKGLQAAVSVHPK